MRRRDPSEQPGCRTVDPDVFFPPTYGGTHRQQVLIAKAVCGRCPLRAPCLAFAVNNAEAHGIWGGTTPVERLALARNRQHRMAAAAG